MSTTTLLHETLKTNFGFEQFRPHQEEIIRTILSKQDVVAIMPTGGGKSICYQLPSLLFPGLTIVISPLIALMKDQVDSLKVNGIQAFYLNSSQDVQTQREIFNTIKSCKAKLLYVAPESLQALAVQLDEVPISFIAIDEAHCISSWGHDFRPAYTQLAFLKKKYPGIPMLALTATADKATCEDFIAQLNLENPQKFVASFDRKNLSLEVRNASDRVKQIIQIIQSRPNESGIIYCLSRKTTEEVAQKLCFTGIKASAYHAGMTFDERTKTQEAFIQDEIQVVCATIAFGMGIDKSNVRFVIHYNLPKNIEGYYQEIGRAGRDGLPAETILFQSYGDVIQLQQFAEASTNAEFQLAKLERMKQFADAKSCRRKILLNYFGELVSEDCGNCDVCKNPPKYFDGTIIAQKALSAVARLKEDEALGVVIDFLRGSRNQHIIERQYDTLKTYGVGQDTSWHDWNQYLIQLINLGYLEIAFHMQNKLKLTSFAAMVLYQKAKVNLIQVPKFVPVEKLKKEKILAPDFKKTGLFEILRLLRSEIAKEEKVPAYIVFSDAVLMQLDLYKPTTHEEFLNIDGVGQMKLMKYGNRFISKIKEYE